MSKIKKLELHLIQNHASCNLNANEDGSPKSEYYGLSQRFRISSQCIKRSIRGSEIFKDIIKSFGESFQTRYLPELVRESMIKKGIDENIISLFVSKIANFGGKDSKKNGKTEEFIHTNQVMSITENEIDNIVSIIEKKIKKSDNIKDLEKMNYKDLEIEIQKQKRIGNNFQISIEIALFGRMITSPAFHDVESCIQVAHAFSTNEYGLELDYMTAIDEFSNQFGKGSAFLNSDASFGQPCFYKYFSIDLDLFASNLKKFNNINDNEVSEIIKSVVRAFIKASVFTTPSGKQNQFGANQLPSFILAELRSNKNSISYSNAFIKPYGPNEKTDLITNSIEKFENYANKVNELYSLEPAKRLFLSEKETEIINDGLRCKNFKIFLNEITESL